MSFTAASSVGLPAALGKVPQVMRCADLEPSLRSRRRGQAGQAEAGDNRSRKIPGDSWLSFRAR